MTTTERRRAASKRSRGAAGVSPNVSRVAAAADVDSETGEELSAAALSVRQRKAAMLLAHGSTQAEAAATVGVDRRTVTRWCDDPAFDALIAHLHATAWERVEPAVFATLELALGVIQQNLRGEIEPDDKRIAAAERLVDRLLNRLFDIGAPPANTPPALNGPHDPPNTVDATFVDRTG